jgi:carboxypeptidase family protein
MLNKKLCLYVVSAITALLYLPPTSFSQTTFGSIVGTVTDPSGAPVAGAQATITNLGTNETRTAPTNADGFYQFVNLTPADYRVEVVITGFSKAVREPVTVAVQTTARIDVALAVGNINQTVEVTAQTPLIQAEASSLGTVVDQRQVNELPLNGRNPMSLAALSPSVVPQGQSGSTPTGTNPFAWGNYQIGGGMANQSQIYLDGSPVNGAYLNITAMIPTQDSLQEFKVQTNNLSAEFGRFAGGIINFTTKSGSNDIHGGAWEFLRNRQLNANTFFNNAAGVPRPAFTQNQFGFNLGGPVYIPRIYKGRDKTFFFVNWEGFRLRQGQSFTETVPTQAQRTGNLSGLGTQIYDPLTTCGAAGAPACGPGQAQYNRTPFTGGVIPPSRLNPTALTMLNLYPLPNAGAGSLVNNFVTNASVGGNNNETVVRLDQNISQNQHLFARYSYWGNLNLPVDPLRNGVCVDRCTEAFNTNNFVISDVITLSPTTILDIRGSYQRFSYDRTPTTAGFDVTTLGWPASLNTQAFNRALPVPCISGYDPANIFCSQGAASTIVDRNDNYRGAGSITKIKGGHTIHAGGEFLRMTLNYAQTNIPTGIFNFDPNFTASNPLAPTGGNSLASFLLGYPASGSAITPALVASQQFYSGAYVQDDWHIGTRLTLNLGFRWEHSGPWTERYDRISYFNPTAVNPLAPNTRGAVGLVNSPGDPYRSNIKPNWKQFAPRVGFAFQVDPKTVVHAGYGLFWIPNNVAWDYSPNNNPINSFTTQYTATLNSGLTPAGTLSNPFPNGIIQPPQRNPAYQQVLLGQNISVPQLSNPYGYAQQWNFDLQHQFGNSVMLDIAYAAAKGTHLPISANINQLPDQFLSLGNQLVRTVANPFAGVVTSGQLSGATISAGQLLRPFPEYQNVLYSGEGVGNSSYNSLQVQSQKRFSKGASVQVAYTWSKLITNSDTVTSWLENGGGTTYQNWNNLRGERSNSANDVPHRLVVSYVMDLPYGRGRKYGAHINGWLNGVIGDWGVEGVTTVQSGFPLHMSTSQNLTNSFGGGSRPNVGFGCAHDTPGGAQQRLNQWFNTGCFSQPPAFTFGNEARVDPTLRSAGIAEWNFSAYKNFPFTAEDRARLQFRAELFNLFNRVQFAPPGTTYGTAQFGVVSSQANNPRLVQFALRFLF